MCSYFLVKTVLFQPQMHHFVHQKFFEPKSSIPCTTHNKHAYICPRNTGIEGYKQTDVFIYYE